MGRYIFLAKMFAMAKNFHFTYEIMQSPSKQVFYRSMNIIFQYKLYEKVIIWKCQKLM